MRSNKLKSLLVSILLTISFIINSTTGFAATNTINKTKNLNNPTNINYLAYAKPQKVVKKELTVYVTRTGSKYHRAGCRYLRQSCIPMKLSEAKKFYEPCSVCNPPQ